MGEGGAEAGVIVSRSAPDWDAVLVEELWVASVDHRPSSHI